MWRILGISLAVLVSPLSSADTQIKSGIRTDASTLKIKGDFGPAGKPNLVIDAFGWSAEFCGLIGCQAVEQVKQDLKINKATCALNVRVRNAGNAPAGAFSVKVNYYHWKGTALLQREGSVGEGLAPGAVKVVSIPASDIGYYHTARPFTATVDFRNQVAESNESDNTATISNP